MTETCLPNVFLIGAPKAGTTTISYWLRHHPDVFVSTPKEPMFYLNIKADFAGPGGQELNDQVVKRREDYLGLFRVGEQSKYRVDASTDYLSDDQAPRLIKKDCPDARILIILRNPVDRIFSEHSHLVRDKLEDRSLLEAISLEARRVNDNWNSLFRHISRSKYAMGVATYFELFGRKNVLVLLYDDLASDPVKTRKRIFEFLHLPDHDPGVPRLNQSGSVKSPIFYDLSRGRIIPVWLKSIIRLIVGQKNLTRLQVMLSRMAIDKPQITNQEEEYIKNLVLNDVKQTSAVIGVDLEKKWFGI